MRFRYRSVDFRRTARAFSIILQFDVDSPMRLAAVIEILFDPLKVVIVVALLTEALVHAVAPVIVFAKAFEVVTRRAPEVLVVATVETIVAAFCDVMKDKISA
ncbi:hypothetical protein BDZ97DRAFT_1844911 [Flammula alnicola]|nr:hypothetical protein BDZ97DRAFT_1844911 [Flammula alnicola]